MCASSVFKCQEHVAFLLYQQLLVSFLHPGFGCGIPLVCLSTCKVIDVASLWVKTKPDISQPSLQSRACDKSV